MVEIRDILREGRFPKEGLVEVFRAVVLEGLTPEQAAAKLDAPSEAEARAIVKRAVEGKLDLIKAKGLGARGPLMGIVMKELRGKVDGKIVATWLQEEIQRLLGSSEPGGKK
jgi:glutamyl-tRNA(Gln) amidotransferase subunit E